jgi:cytochrome c553
VKPIVKRVLQGVGGLVGLVVVGGGAFAAFQAHAFGSSLDKVYDVPVPSITRTSDPVALERGHHIASTIAPCAVSDCHGSDLGGGKLIEVGPLGRFSGPNISSGGLGAVYSDGEIARLVRHGLKKDGRTVRFMPAHEFNWLSEADLTAVISWLRTVPAVQKPNGPFEIGLLGKILDRLDMIPLDVARRIDHTRVELAPPPTPTAAYGAFIGRACTGCHGSTLSGGPIPGAPPEMAVPLNLTPHQTGLQGWTFEDFKKTLETGVNKKGKKLDEMMPTAALAQLDDTEMHALFAYLASLPARPYGGR